MESLALKLVCDSPVENSPIVSKSCRVVKDKAIVAEICTGRRSHFDSFPLVFTFILVMKLGDELSKGFLRQKKKRESEKEEINRDIVDLHFGLLRQLGGTKNDNPSLTVHQTLVPGLDSSSKCAIEEKLLGQSF